MTLYYPQIIKKKRENGICITDVWDDIREFTSGYLAGREALKDEKNSIRIYKQQSPITLLLRIILSSILTNDLIFDPLI